MLGGVKYMFLNQHSLHVCNVLIHACPRLPSNTEVWSTASTLMHAQACPNSCLQLLQTAGPALLVCEELDHYVAVLLTGIVCLWCLHRSWLLWFPSLGSPCVETMCAFPLSMTANMLTRHRTPQGVLLLTIIEDDMVFCDDRDIIGLDR
jgi:hypothetical protein